MAKLVGVIHDEDDTDSTGSGRRSRLCLSRRQLPLTIEPDLTMIMALDDSCLACNSSTLGESSSTGKKEQNSALAADRKGFLRKCNALSKDELTAALMVSFDDLITTLGNEVVCVGCRRSVESLLNKLYTNGDSALEPLVITDDKVVSVGRDHISAPQSLANLFCDQLSRLQVTLLEPVSNGKNRKKGGVGRCPSHSMGLVGSKKMLLYDHWLETWECMERECQEEVVLVHFDLLRTTVDRYLKKHSFCGECTNMVNKAFNLLVQEQGPCEAALQPGTAVASKSKLTPEERKALDMYKGLTACINDQHVHVECQTEFVSRLVNLAEPELRGLRQERHAKTIEIAQKEILTCIGICLYERFHRIQQKLREGQQSCDLLFMVALKSLRKSFEVAFESKQGISDLEKLCQELDAEERKKQEKAQKKRDKKIASKKKKNESREVAVKEVEVKVEKDGDVVPEAVDVVNEERAATKMAKEAVVESAAKLKICRRRTTRPPPSSAECISVLKLASMLEQENDFAQENLVNDDCSIPLEDIRQFRANLRNVSQQREELRRNLRQKFAQLCVNGL